MELSGGERSMLNLFSRIYDVVKTQKENPPSLLLIDEGETSLHPEWQRHYVEILAGFLNVMACEINAAEDNGEKGFRFQVVLTTHSPLLLSDFPGCSINYLGEGSCESTFGANIYDLYRESFFLSHGFVGSFATDKIRQVADMISGMEERNEVDVEKVNYCSEIIALIGEPRVKSYLSARLNKVKDSRPTIEDLRRKQVEIEEMIRKMEGK